MFKNRIFIILCRILLGGIFIYASIDKILNPEAFSKILYNYKLLPSQFIYFPAIFLPWVELIAGSFLISGIFLRGSSFIINSLLLIFIVALATNLIRGVNFDCGCFSTLSGTGSNAVLLLVRDLLLLIPGLWVFLSLSRKDIGKN